MTSYVKKNDIRVFAFRLRCSFHTLYFWHMIYFQFCSSFQWFSYLFRPPSPDYKSYSSKCESCRDKYMCRTTVGTKVCHEREKRSMGITRKWRTGLAPLKPFVKTSGFMWRTVEIATYSLSLWKEIVIS